MQMETRVKRRILKNAQWSILLYALPVVLMFAWYYATGQRPAVHAAPINHSTSLGPWAWLSLDRYGLVVFTIVLGILEFAFGRYDEHWTGNEKCLDAVCFVLPKLVIAPVTAYFSLKMLPVLLPGLAAQLCVGTVWMGTAHHRGSRRPHPVLVSPRPSRSPVAMALSSHASFGALHGY